MDLNIKDEPIDYEDDEIKLLDYNVSVKIEDCATQDDVWYARNEAVFAEIEKQLNEAEKNNECRICGQRFVERYSLLTHNMQHLRVVIRNKMFQCQICSKYYTNQQNLQKHISSHNKKKVTEMDHKCHICNIILSYKRWREHIKYAHTNEIYECQKCLTKFKSPIYLRRHKMYVHDGIKAAWRHRTDSNLKINCKECNKVFTNKNSLTNHIKNCHTKPHQCFICKSILKSRTYLMTHMRRLHDVSTHECEICGKKFKSLRYVNIHIKNSHIKKKIKKEIKKERTETDID